MEPTARHCYFCSKVYERGINAPHWTGTEYVRVDVCSEQACRDRIASAPRRPRKARVQPILDRGGWAAVPGLNRMMADRK